MKKITRKEQKEKTRQGLVAEATALFSKNGIATTTTADVAKALQVSHGTVFIHFPTRDELILAVVETFGDRLAKELIENLTNDMDLKELLQAHLKVLSEFENFYFRLICESHSLPPHIRSLVYAMNASLSYRFYKAAQKLMKDDEIKKMDQVSFFNSWMAIIHYQIMNRDLFSDKTPILKYKSKEIIRQFFLLITKE